MRLFVVLVHYPVYNRRHGVVATAITNLDIHDIARASRSYGVEGVLVVNPLERQRWLLERILHHWQQGHGAQAHPNRREALEHVYPMGTLQEALAWVESRCAQVPATVATTARSWPGAVDYPELRGILTEQERPFVILLGTGWGLTDEVVEGASYVLHPVLARASYNHLSVRSAAAVILDRLVGDR